MSVTIKNIAEIAGVSIGTISRALNNDPLIAESTRKRIHSLANDMDYVPSNIGKALQSKKSRLIGLLIADVTYSSYNEILQGIDETVHKEQYGLLVGLTGADSHSEQEQLRFFREKAVDGLIVTNFHAETVPALEKLRASGIPVVICDLKSYSLDLPEIRVDDAKAMGLLMMHLIELGHQKFAFCYAINANSLERYSACKSMAQEHNMDIPDFCNNESDLIRLLESDNPPTAILSYSDLIAVDIMHLLKTKGLSIPNEISLTGFDDMHFSSWPEINLTTIKQPKTLIGTRSAELLFKLIDKNEYDEGVLIEPELIVRGSTGKKT